MLQIFHTPRSRSLRVVWMAEEMGLPYESAGAFPAIHDGDVGMTVPPP